MGIRLTRFSLRGLKSIREVRGFEPAALNVLIGANGAGKSNLIAFFRLLSWMTTSGLQEHVGLLGGANAVLHDGAERTGAIEAEIALETEQGTNEYAFRLSFAAGDTLIFTDEKFRFSRRDRGVANWIQLGAGHREAALVGRADGGDVTARTILTLLKKCVVYQFHNTSFTSRMRQKWDVNDSRWLKEDGQNLAAFLLRLRDEEPKYYQRIVGTTRLLLPFFADYVLEEDKGHRILLQWREAGSDVVFGAHQASDGMLRTMALLTLLLQPERDLPAVLLLDEPELGLHPAAISVVAGAVRAVASQSQVILATQSTAFVNQFEPGEIVVVDRTGRESKFRRLDATELADWLKDYSLAELWEKNVIGGRPA